MATGGGAAAGIPPYMNEGYVDELHYLIFRYHGQIEINNTKIAAIEEECLMLEERNAVLHADTTGYDTRNRRAQLEYIVVLLRTNTAEIRRLKAYSVELVPELQSAINALEAVPLEWRGYPPSTPQTDVRPNLDRTVVLEEPDTP